MLPLRDRLAPVLLVVFGAPISAEYLQAYLPSTGDAAVMAGSLLILGPLYGGAALLIRELAVRRGMGWTGVLLLAGGFGVLMPGVVDLALFAEHRPDVSYWDPMREGTLIAPLGVSAYSAITWSVSHVVLSVGAPLALLAALAPRHGGQPLLGRRGIVLIGALWLVAAAFIRSDGMNIYDYQPSVAQTAGALAVVAALTGLAFTRLGRPVAPSGSGGSRLSWVLAAGAGGVLALDLVPWTWPGVAVLAGLLTTGAVAARHRAIVRGWGTREIGALAAGGLVGRTLTGFLSPVPDGVDAAAKLGQNALLLAGTVALAWLVVRRRPRPGRPVLTSRVPATSDRSR